MLHLFLYIQLYTINTYVFRKPMICSRFFLDLLVIMLLYVCLSIHHSFTAVSADRAHKTLPHYTSRGRSTSHTSHSHWSCPLTSDRRCAFTVVQDGQLPKHVTRGQSSEVTTGLHYPQLSIWNNHEIQNLILTNGMDSLGLTSSTHQSIHVYPLQLDGRTYILKLQSITSLS